MGSAEEVEQAFRRAGERVAAGGVWCPVTRPESAGSARGVAGQPAQVIAVQRVLARTTWQKLVAGQTADDVYPEAVADADRAFALLETGTGDSS